MLKKLSPEKVETDKNKKTKANYEPHIESRRRPFVDSPTIATNGLPVERYQSGIDWRCAMAATRRYDEDLRAIGQVLEARDISVFELKRAHCCR